jgi:hypothetical protein
LNNTMQERCVQKNILFADLKMVWKHDKKV